MYGHQGAAHALVVNHGCKVAGLEHNVHFADVDEKRKDEKRKDELNEQLKLATTKLSLRKTA